MARRGRGGAVRTTCCLRGNASIDDVSITSRRHAAVMLATGAAVLHETPAMSYAESSGSAYDFDVTLEGEPVSLSQYRGRVSLIVNIASE